MPVRFNANEIFEMAIRAERNGAAFYREAARLHPEADERALLDELAAMEDQHLAVFRGMQAELAGRLDPAGDYVEATLYLDALSDAHGGEGAPRVTAALTGRESMAQILQTAIELERRSILYYLGLRDMVPADLGRDRVETIIAEEQGHVAVLARELRRHLGR